MKKSLFIRGMKLTAFLVFITCLHISAAGLSQTVNLEGKNLSLEQIFSEIRQQTGYAVFINKALLDNTSPVTVRAKQMPLTQFLDHILGGQKLSYEISKTTIVVSEAKLSASPESLVLAYPEVRGRVVDSLGNPLQGASIRVLNAEGKRTTLQTSTDKQGEFLLLNVPQDAKLEISFVGFVTQKITANAIMGSIVLMGLSSELEEASVIVNTGYQSIPKERATGSFTQIDNKLFNRAVGSDILSRLENVTNALSFDKRTGNNRISIRGISTLTTTMTSPLIVVDNFPYDGDINNINPNDLESVTILKDAAASSIWGAKAGNGVIVITTKRAKYNQAQSIQVNTNFQIVNRPNIFYNRDYLPSTSYIDVEKMLFENGYYDNILSDPTNPPLSSVITTLDELRAGKITQEQEDAQINPFKSINARKEISKYFYQKAVNQQYAINISGGSHNYNYYHSVGYDGSQNSLVNNGTSRITLLSTNIFRPVKKLELTFGLNYVQELVKLDNTLSMLSPGDTYGTYLPYTKLVASDGVSLPVLKDYSTGFAQSAESNGFLNWQFYPVEELRAKWNVVPINNYDIRLNGGIKYMLLDGLSAELKYQYERSLSMQRYVQGIQSYYVRNMVNMYSSVEDGSFSDYVINPNGILSTYTANLNSQSGRGQLNYTRNWHTNTLTAIAGMEVRNTSSNSNSNSYYGYDENTGSFQQSMDYNSYFGLYPSDGSAQIPSGMTLGSTIDRFVSYFANASYSYKDKYIISASGRKDASNLFGATTNNKWKPLYSFGGSWLISKEPFYPIHFIPYLRLKATYGHSGNVNNTIPALATIQYQDYSARGTNLSFALINNPPNPQLKWEQMGMYNLGLEFKSTQNRISGTIEYYIKKSKDLLSTIPFDATQGVMTMNTNSASLSGKGIDIQINGNIPMGRMSLSTALIINYLNNKVTKYNASTVYGSAYTNSGTFINPFAGKPVYAIYSYKWAGLDPNTGDPRGYLDKAISTDYSAIAKDSAQNLVYNGSAVPVYYGSLMNTISYKRLSLSFNIVYKLRYYFRRSTISYSDLYSKGIGNLDYLSRWQKSGDEIHTTIPSLVYPANSYRDQFYANSEAAVEKGDNIRLQDIRLSYDLLLKNKPQSQIHSLGFFFYCNNLGIIWRANKSNVDPDYGSSGMPAPRTFSFGVKTNL